VDDIIVIKGGEIIEHGTFGELMKMRGHLAALVGEHVQIFDLEEHDTNLSKNEEDDSYPKNLIRTFSRPKFDLKYCPSIASNLTEEQFVNRSKMSITANIPASDASIVKHIESTQLVTIGREASVNNLNTIKIIERNELSIFTKMDEADEPVSSHDPPMKLVLEDQSVHYKAVPLLSYLRAGYGLPITLLVFVFFGLIHVIRILSGEH
jgi:hypothetical protein